MTDPFYDFAKLFEQHAREIAAIVSREIAPLHEAVTAAESTLVRVEATIGKVVDLLADRDRDESFATALREIRSLRETRGRDT